MIIYNITMQVEWSIHDEWLEWLLEEQIKSVLDTGLFTHHRLVRLLEVEETEGPTYALQYFTGSLQQYHQFKHEHAEKMERRSQLKWGDRFISFGTVMETIEQG